MSDPQDSNDEAIAAASVAIVAALQPFRDDIADVYKFPLQSSLDTLVKRVRADAEYQVVSQDDKADLSKLHSDVKSLNESEDMSKDLLHSQTQNLEVEQVIDVSDHTLFTVTLQLRKLVHKWLKKYPTLRVPLAKWIVIDWGGVDRRKTHDYEALVNAANNWPSRSDIGEFAHIARWSKYLAFFHPEAAAIFDSRVAYSLNWYLRDTQEAKLFPCLPSENRLLSALDHTIIIAGGRVGWDKLREEVRADIRAVERGNKSRIGKIVERASQVVSDLDAYCYYVKLLRRVSNELYDKSDSWRLTKTEMLLFGLATTRVAWEVFEEFSRVDRDRYSERVSFAIPARSYYFPR